MLARKPQQHEQQQRALYEAAVAPKLQQLQQLQQQVAAVAGAPAAAKIARDKVQQLQVALQLSVRSLPNASPTCSLHASNAHASSTPLERLSACSLPAESSARTRSFVRVVPAQANNLNPADLNRLLLSHESKQRRRVGGTTYLAQVAVMPTAPVALPSYPGMPLGSVPTPLTRLPRLLHASYSPLSRLLHVSPRLFHASYTPLTRLLHASYTPLTRPLHAGMRDDSVSREMQRRRQVKRQRKWEEEEEVTYTGFRTHSGLE